jgi:hypothetical protein
MRTNDQLNDSCGRHSRFTNYFSRAGSEHAPDSQRESHQSLACENSQPTSTQLVDRPTLALGIRSQIEFPPNIGGDFDAYLDFPADRRCARLFHSIAKGRRSGACGEDAQTGRDLRRYVAPISAPPRPLRRGHPAIANEVPQILLLAELRLDEPSPAACVQISAGEVSSAYRCWTALTICCETVSAVPLISPNPHPQIQQLQDSTSWGSRK